jgi:hypothetical protein
MRTLYFALALTGILLPACTSQGQKEPAVRDLEPRPVADDDDPVNKEAASSVDGLVLTVTIDSASIRLDDAILAKIPEDAAQRGAGAAGDRVTAVAFAGGNRVSEGSAADGVLNVQEGVGVVRLARRQVVISLPAPRPVEEVEVSAPATGAKARLDVRSAYDPYCKDRRDDKNCPRPRPR